MPAPAMAITVPKIRLSMGKCRETRARLRSTAQMVVSRKRKRSEYCHGRLPDRERLPRRPASRGFSIISVFIPRLRILYGRGDAVDRSVRPFGAEAFGRARYRSLRLWIAKANLRTAKERRQALVLPRGAISAISSPSRPCERDTPRGQCPRP